MPRYPSFVATVYTKRPSDPSAMTSPFPIPVWDQQSVDLDKEVEALRRKLGSEAAPGSADMACGARGNTKMPALAST